VAARRSLNFTQAKDEDMFIVAQHHISDPERFWNAVEEAMPNIPASTKVHHVFPNGNGTTAVCLWECESLNAVREIVDGTVGEYSNNTYFEVSVETAMGLPGQAASTT
jgi:hypothetical protein